MSLNVIYGDSEKWLRKKFNFIVKLLCSKFSFQWWTSVYANACVSADVTVTMTVSCLWRFLYRPWQQPQQSLHLWWQPLPPLWWFPWQQLLCQFLPQCRDPCYLWRCWMGLQWHGLAFQVSVEVTLSLVRKQDHRNWSCTRPVDMFMDHWKSSTTHYQDKQNVPR